MIYVYGWIKPAVWFTCLCYEDTENDVANPQRWGALDDAPRSGGAPLRTTRARGWALIKRAYLNCVNIGTVGDFNLIYAFSSRKIFLMVWLLFPSEKGKECHETVCFLS